MRSFAVVCTLAVIATFSRCGGGSSFTPVAANPEFSPAPGTYSTTQTVSISDATPGAIIYYTTNGSIPLYRHPFKNCSA